MMKEILGIRFDNKSPIGLKWKTIVKYAIIVLIELYLFTQYTGHDASIHFFIHSLVGVSVGLSLFIILILFGKKPVELILVIFVLHQSAMIPDYLYSLGYPHQLWMNIFLGHLFFDSLPYHEWILGTTVAVLTGSYLLIRKHKKHETY